MKNDKIKIRVATPLASTLGLRLARHIERISYFSAQPVSEECSSSVLRYGTQCDRRSVNYIVNSIWPIWVDLLPQEDLGREMKLEIALKNDPGKYKISIYAEGENLGKEICSYLREIGFSIQELRNVPVKENRLDFGAAPIDIISLIFWPFYQQEITLEEHKCWSDSDYEIHLRFADPLLTKLSPKERYQLRIFTDETEAVAELAEKFAARGYKQVKVLDIDTAGLYFDEPAFYFTPGPFADSLAEKELKCILDEFVEAEGVNQLSHPLKIAQEEEAMIILPLGLWRHGHIPPYSGPFPERFKVVIASDQPEKTTRLQEKLKQAGFRDVQAIKNISEEVDDFEVFCGALFPESSLREKLRGLVREAMDELGVDSDLVLHLKNSCVFEKNEIKINFPVTGVDDGSLKKRLQDPRRFGCGIFCGEKESGAQLQRRLLSWGFGILEFKNKNLTYGSIGTGNVNLLHFGAPPALLKRLAREIKRSSGVAALIKKSERVGNKKLIFIEIGKDIQFTGEKIDPSRLQPGPALETDQAAENAGQSENNSRLTWWGFEELEPKPAEEISDLPLAELEAELGSLLSEMKTSDELPRRAFLLQAAIKRIAPPDSTALKFFSEGNRIGDVEKIVRAVRNSLESDRPWLLAGMVKLHITGFPKRKITRMVRSLWPPSPAGKKPV